jgi:N-acetylglucosamine-6-phosphate deacetylase
MTVLSADKVVTPGGVLEPGWVGVEGGRITRVEEGRPETSDRHAHVIVPGFIDIHCHGGGGASFDSADPEECVRAAAFHREHGTTTLIASLVTASPADLERRASVLAELADDGVVAGVHYEGPFLSPARKGAHDPTLLRAPDPTTVDRLLKIPHVRMVTLAPELDGGMDALRRVRDAGVIPAVGHTDATYDVVREATRAGARVATHLFNGMRPLHHREPGPILALLEAPEVVVELVGDGVHLHPSIVAHVAQVAGSVRTALVTDAIAAAGMSDGEYRLGGLDVEVSDGVARLTEGGSIAGSTATAAAVFRRTVLTSGVGLEDAVRLAATTPSVLFGLNDRGAIAHGLRADLVLLDEDLRVQSVVTA